MRFRIRFSGYVFDFYPFSKKKKKFGYVKRIRKCDPRFRIFQNPALGCSGYDLDNEQVRNVQARIGAEMNKISETYFLDTEMISELGPSPFLVQAGAMTIAKTFAYKTGPAGPRPSGFCWTSPSTVSTLIKLGRAMMLDRPIILEGSPGVGKTSIVAALAAESGYDVTRINLSEQTDVSDLFGADLPVEGGVGGAFEWKDGPLLIALKQGHWVILDELNLASQPVLEGLNSAFDHRGELFIPELNRTFSIKNQHGTRFFACQNPRVQGGGRKGLPKSFLNRFTRVYCDTLSVIDIVTILTKPFSTISEVFFPNPQNMGDLTKHPFFDKITNIFGQYGELRGDVNKCCLAKIVAFNFAVDAMLKYSGLGTEFNLRDLMRFCFLINDIHVPIERNEFTAFSRHYGPRFFLLCQGAKFQFVREI